MKKIVDEVTPVLLTTRNQKYTSDPVTVSVQNNSHNCIVSYVDNTMSVNEMQNHFQGCTPQSVNFTQGTDVSRYLQTKEWPYPEA